MIQNAYDKTSLDSILAFSNLLTGKSLDEIVTLPGDVENPKSKGDLGRLIEAHFFGIRPSNREIDFPEAGLELKVTGLNRGANGTYVAKERLVLGMINFHTLVTEDWETSYIFLKCQLMLILFYLYKDGVPKVSQKFVLPPLLYKIDEWDEADLKRDWEAIREKVTSGLAHELSEGDTFLLGACRKGAGGERDLVSQPGSGIKAKSRAFSFKPSYLNRVIQRHQGIVDGQNLNANTNFEDSTLRKFTPFIGLTVEEISASLGYFKSSSNHKGFLHDLSRRILGTNSRSLPEFEANAIEMKTVRLQRNGKPREHMSFPHFDFETVSQQVWEESDFFEKVERKFLFVVFDLDSSGRLKLSKAFFWNMPYLDRLEAGRVWETTKNLILSSRTSFPKPRESAVAHVRPKGADGKDTRPLPDGTNFSKQCFWLNRGYIAEIISQDGS